jgi:uncharacterized protein YwgA
MARRDWLILLLGFKGADGPALDPVRVQKGMFLFAQESGAGEAERYSFEPYNYGPYSFELRDDLRHLVAEGLAEAQPVPGYTWNKYKLTAAGMERAQAVRDGSQRELAKKVFQIKQRITGKSFNALLRDVYDDYPEFASNSIFRR